MALAEIQGWAEQGTALAVCDDPSQQQPKNVQAAYPGATVTVYLPGTVTPASIYSDAVGTVKANPFAAGTDASWAFYAALGAYDVKFSGGLIATPFTVRVGEPVPPISVVIGPAYVSAGDFSGADAGQKMANAIASLPATGGTVDARSLSGNQNINQNIFGSATCPVRVLLGFATYTITAQQVFTPNSSFIGEGRGATVIKAASTFTAQSALLVADSCEVRTLTLQGRNVGFSSAFGYGIIAVANASKILIEDNEIYNWDASGVSLGQNGPNAIIRHNWIHNNLNRGVYVPLQARSALVEGNYVYLNGFNGVEIRSQYAQVKNNVVYQNGQDTTNSPAFPADHHGISLYPQTGDAWNHEVLGNLVYNNAADGIHIAIGSAGTNGQNWFISNNIVNNNGTSGNGSGIYVDGDPTGDTLQNVRILDNTTYANQKYGIGVIGSKATATEVRGNFSVNNVNADYADTGTGTVAMINRLGGGSVVAAFPTGVSIGNGASITQMQVYSQALTPAAVPAASVSYQYFTVIGIRLANEVILDVSAQPDVGIVLSHWRVAGDNSIELGWTNPTAAPVTPTAGRTYTITTIRH